MTTVKNNVLKLKLSLLRKELDKPLYGHGGSSKAYWANRNDILHRMSKIVHQLNGA